MNFRALLLFVALVQLASATVPLLGTDHPEVISGQYVFVFHEDSTQQQRDNYMMKLFKSISGDLKQTIIDRYDIGTFHGFSARLNDGMLNLQRRQDKLIKYVAADQVVHALEADVCNTQQGPDWGLDRTDTLGATLDGNYRYNAIGGAGVDAYIVDTGIRTTHTDFGGRATWGVNYADTTNSDCNGHGTHVAGTVGGTTWGIAKSVNLIAVKVLGCTGSGSWAGVISGVQWVAQQYQAKNKRPSVANMSLGGGLYQALNDAVAAAITVGVSFVVAAGNNNMDACSFSPASTPTSISVGATTIDNSNGNGQDDRAYFSNFGSCVTIMGPGVLVTSAYIGSDTDTRALSGTSMASPHVCGVAAMYLGLNPLATTTQVKNALVAAAEKNVVDMLCTSAACNLTPNLMLHNACA